MKSSGAAVFTRQDPFPPARPVGRSHYHPSPIHSLNSKKRHTTLSPVRPRKAGHKQQPVKPEEKHGSGEADLRPPASSITRTGQEQQPCFSESWPSTEQSCSPSDMETFRPSAGQPRGSGDLQDSVLAKYVDRFRHGRPQSREERQQSREEDQCFWWMREPSPLPCSSTPTHTSYKADHHTESPGPLRHHSSPPSPSPYRDILDFSALGLSDTSHGDLVDPDILQLQERAGRLLLRSEGSVSSESVPISSEGLGCSEFSSPVSVEEPVRRTIVPSMEEPVRRTMEAVTAGTPSSASLHVGPSSSVPRPADDILFQWRLRRKMELARQWTPPPAQWTPPPAQWTPPPAQWTPPPAQWTPPPAQYPQNPAHQQSQYPQNPAQQQSQSLQNPGQQQSQDPALQQSQAPLQASSQTVHPPSNPPSRPDAHQTATPFPGPRPAATPTPRVQGDAQSLQNPAARSPPPPKPHHKPHPSRQRSHRKTQHAAASSSSSSEAESEQEEEEEGLGKRGRAGPSRPLQRASSVTTEEEERSATCGRAERNGQEKLHTIQPEKKKAVASSRKHKTSARHAGGGGVGVVGGGGDQEDPGCSLNSRGSRRTPGRPQRPRGERGQQGTHRDTPRGQHDTYQGTLIEERTGDRAPPPSPIHCALGQVVSEVLFPSHRRSPVSWDSPGSRSPPAPPPQSPAPPPPPLEVITQLLQEAQDSDETEFEDDPLLQVLRKQRTWVKDQISEVDSMLEEFHQLTS